MDNDAFDHFQQDRREPRDRALHAKLLNVLADDSCPLVVFDSIFKKPGNPARDKELAGALETPAPTCIDGRAGGRDLSIP